MSEIKLNPLHPHQHVGASRYLSCCIAVVSSQLSCLPHSEAGVWRCLSVETQVQFLTVK